MKQIADWLKKLDMSEYTDRFVENRIDISVLPDLTEQHLKDLGIALGDRLKMLRAIRDLGNASVAATAPPTSAVTEPIRRDDAERRQLTVMFTDLVGSTALSTRLDPEDLRSVIGAYHKCVAQTVGRFGGFVARYMGDGAIRKRTKTTPSGRCGADWRSSKRLESWAALSRYKYESALAPAWSWLAISSALGKPRNAVWSVRRQTWRRVCRQGRRRAPSPSI
jgi:class 3 adenylate cyclase